MEPTTEKIQHTPNGGDVRSNADTIAALRDGVDINHRLAVIEARDHRGVDHAVPIRLSTGAGSHGTESIVAVDKEAIAEIERRAAGPRRRSGTLQLGALGSLIDYVNRFKRPEETVAFAPLQPAGVTVVFDYHPKGGDLAAWREDRATFACPISRQWRLWTEAAGKPMTQLAFGDFVEQAAEDLSDGDGDGYVGALDLLKVARKLTIKTKGEFSREVDPTSGQGSLIVKSEHGTESTKIPKGFRLAIPVFEGAEERYVLECRIRFAMSEDRPAFAFIIHNQADVWDDALKGLRTRLTKDCAIPVFIGTAPQAAR